MMQEKNYLKLPQISAFRHLSSKCGNIIAMRKEGIVSGEEALRGLDRLSRNASVLFGGVLSGNEIARQIATSFRLDMSASIPVAAVEKFMRAFRESHIEYVDVDYVRDTKMILKLPLSEPRSHYVATGVGELNSFARELQISQDRRYELIVLAFNEINSCWPIANSKGAFEHMGYGAPYSRGSTFVTTTQKIEIIDPLGPSVRHSNGPYVENRYLPEPDLQYAREEFAHLLITYRN